MIGSPAELERGGGDRTLEKDAAAVRYEPRAYDMLKHIHAAHIHTCIRIYMHVRTSSQRACLFLDVPTSSPKNTTSSESIIGRQIWEVPWDFLKRNDMATRCIIHVIIYTRSAIAQSRARACAGAAQTARVTMKCRSEI